MEGLPKRWVRTDVDEAFDEAEERGDDIENSQYMYTECDTSHHHDYFKDVSTGAYTRSTYPCPY